MKKKHLIIIIAQSIVIISLTVYAFVKQTKANVAEREALAQKELADFAQQEAEKQRRMAEASSMEAQRQNKIASELQKKLEGKK